MIGYEALRDDRAAVRLERDFLVVRGPDATSYLQGQLSQDVEALATGTAALSLLLEPQGRISAFLRVTRCGDDDYVIDTEAGSGSDALLRLQRFKLRTKVDIEPLVGWECIGVRGSRAPADAEAGWDRAGTDAVAAFPWPGAGGVDLLGAAPLFPDGVPEADAEAFDVWRIECGLPASGRDLDERTIPEEAGIVPATVSFTKGCYTGQELVARIDSRGGNVPRRLRILRAAEGTASIPVGAELAVGDQSAAGVVTSVSAHPAGGQVGLAYVKRGFADSERAEARWDGGTAPLTLHAPPRP